MSVVYRARFMESLRRMIQSGEVAPLPDMNVQSLISRLYAKDRVVYAKAPFAGPDAVIAYLGRYRHMVAICNHRMVSFDRQLDRVCFRYKDYADGGKHKEMTLSTEEFIHRFEQHILPKGFTKIRTYGYLANRDRRVRINGILLKMKLPLHKGLIKVPVQVKLKELFGINIQACSCCKKNTMELLLVCHPWKQEDDG